MKLLHQHDEQVSELQETIAELEQSPAIQAFKQEKEAIRLAQRKETAARLQELETELTTAAHSDALGELESELKDLDARRKRVANELNKGRVALKYRTFSLEARIAKARSELFESCDKQIIEAIQFFNDQIDTLRKGETASTRRMGGERNLFSEKKISRIENNQPAILSALKYCQRALQELELMKLSPEADTGRIEELKAAIPSTDTFTAFEIEKGLNLDHVPTHQDQTGGLFKRLR